MAVRKNATRSQFAVMKAFFLGVAFSLVLLLLFLGGKTLLALPADVVGAGVIRLVSSFSRFWVSVTSYPKLLLQAHDANRELNQMRTKLAQLQVELWRVQELIEENRRLKKLLGLAKDLSRPYIAAEVIDFGGSNWFHTLVINKGSQDGIREGAPVLCHKGLVGRVWEVRSHHSVVLLLTDRHSAVGVALTEHQGVYGIVKGTGKRWCELVHLSRHTVPKKGEVLVTSGLGGVFPKGIPVGEVVSVSVTTEPPTVRVRPLFRLDELREFIVLTDLPPPVSP